MTDPLRFHKSKFGEFFKLRIDGSSQDIQQFYQKIWNYGYIEGKLDWITDSSASLYVSKKNFKKLKIKAVDIPVAPPRKYTPDSFHISKRKPREPDNSLSLSHWARLPLDTIIEKFARK